MAFISMLPASRVLKRKNTVNGEKVLKRLKDYLDNNTEGPIRLLCGFWDDQRDVLSYQEIRQLILDGDLNSSLAQQWADDYTYMLSNSFTPYWIDAMSAGATSQPIMDSIADIFTFDTTTPGVTNWIKDHGAELVTNVTETQKEGIRYLLGESVRNTYGMDELAHLIRPCVGLTKGQTSAAEKYYRNIKDSLKKDHPRMSAESIRTKALDATAKYSEKMHRYRADMIVQTEMAYAYNRGADEGIRQAQRDYLIGKVVMRWSTSGDDRVCETCRALEGKTVGIEEAFSVSGTRYSDGEYDIPPAHPNCACAVEYQEVEGIPEVLNGFKYNVPDGAIEKGRDLSNAFYDVDHYSDVDVVKKADELVSMFTNNPSNWSGRVITFKNNKSLGGFKIATGDIYLRNDSDLRTAIHEVLHSRTIYGKNWRVYAWDNDYLDEASTEYLAEHICANCGIPFEKMTYRERVERLMDIAQMCQMDDLDLAQKLYNVRYSERYNALGKIIENRSKEIGLSDETVKKLNSIREDLKGHKMLRKLMKSKNITTAQELIDLINNGYQSYDEFVELYYTIQNADLSEEEMTKFAKSGAGDVILQSALAQDLDGAFDVELATEEERRKFRS